MSDRKAAGLGQWVTNHPWVVIVATIIIIFAAASGGRFLHFTTDYRAFFSESNPQLLAFEELQDTYTKNDNVIFVLAPQSEEVFSNDTLAAVEWLTEEAWQIPYSIRVDSISNFQHTKAEEDDLIVQDLVTDSADLSDSALAEIKSIAISEPQLYRRLVSERAHTTGVMVTIQLPGLDGPTEVPDVVEFSRGLVNQFEAKYPHIDIHLTGIVMMNMTFQEASQNDLSTLVPAMYIVILIMIGLLLRGFSGIFATFLLLSFSIAGAMGLAGWVKLGLTGPSATAPIIILTLAVADSVHVLSTMFYEMRANALSKRDAIIESLRINFQPVFLTSLSTAIGFLTMNLGEVPPFAHMGNIVAVGVGIAFVLSITFLPAIMMVLPVRVKPTLGKLESGSGGVGPHKHAMEKFADFVIDKRTPLFWGVGVAMILMMAFIPRNSLNDNYVEYFDESFDFRQATEFLTENLTGLYDVHYSLGAGEAEGISDPSYLQKVEDFAIWYRQQPGIVHVNVLSDTFKRLNKNLHADEQDYYRLPEQKDLAAQYLLLYEMSLPYGLDLNNQISVDKSSIKVSITMETMTTNEVLKLMDDARQWLSENGLPSMQVEGSSTTVMFSHIGYRNIRAMLIAAFAALVIISLILIVALKSLKHGLISLIPNLAPAGVAFGVWGYFVGEVGLALSVIVSVTLGIVVDDTIHFMSKYLRARREKGYSGADAVRYAFRSVGVALLVTTTVLVAGFMVLAQSHFKINAEMGLMTAITITLAIVIDFLFLPPLLLKLEDKNREKINRADSAVEPTAA